MGMGGGQRKGLLEWGKEKRRERGNAPGRGMGMGKGGK